MFEKRFQPPPPNALRFRRVPAFIHSWSYTKKLWTQYLTYY